MNDFLTEDTKAIILLCGVFGKDRTAKPLSLTEYSALVNWLVGASLRPSDLLLHENVGDASKGSGLDRQRLEVLLGRGVQLGFAVEEWQRNGIWIISRSDEDYPKRLKNHLGKSAPPLLFGVGQRKLLVGGGLAIVGSRNVDEVGESFTCQAAELCAQNRMPVVSGGARGVDQISMTAALEAGGVTIGLLAENLFKKSVERKNRQAIADGRLLLLSPYHPNARFTVGTAMARNKLIYAMADYGLVVSAEHKKGGTWAGAQEELKRDNSLPVFVRIGSDTPQGNSKLVDLGAIPWPDSIERDSFSQQLNDLAVNSKQRQPKKNLSILDFQATQKAVSKKEDLPEKEPEKDKAKIVRPEVTFSEHPSSVYHAVLPFILSRLDTPTTADELANTLEVNKTQLNVWLKKAVEEKKIRKLSKPVRYQKTGSGMQV